MSDISFSYKRKNSPQHFVQKQPDETFYINVDFSDALATGETLIVGSSEVNVTDSDGTDVSNTISSAGSLTVSGTILKIIIQNGSSTEKWYNSQFLAATSFGLTYSQDIKIITTKVNYDSPSSSNQLVATRTGTFTYSDLSSGVLTITHNLGISGPPTVVIYNNNDTFVLPDNIIKIDANSCSVYLSSFGVISGTWSWRIS